MQKTCDICQNINNPETEVMRTDTWVVHLAGDQGYLGRCYVTLLDHKGSLSELSDAEWNSFRNIAKQLELAFTKAFGADPCNWSCLLNNAFRVEPADPHVHWHLRPRHKQKVTVNGVVFDDPDYGSHYDREHRRRVDSQTFQAIKQQIVDSL